MGPDLTTDLRESAQAELPGRFSRKLPVVDLLALRRGPATVLASARPPIFSPGQSAAGTIAACNIQNLGKALKILFFL
jgi:hypothetical protein